MAGLAPPIIAAQAVMPNLGNPTTAHLRYAGDALQSENLPESLAARGSRRSQTDRLLEMGAEAGGPLKEGRSWLWGAFARNALRQDTFTGHVETPRTTSLTGKGRLYRVFDAHTS